MSHILAESPRLGLIQLHQNSISNDYIGLLLSVPVSRKFPLEYLRSYSKTPYSNGIKFCGYEHIEYNKHSNFQHKELLSTWDAAIERIIETRTTMLCDCGKRHRRYQDEPDRVKLG